MPHNMGLPDRRDTASPMSLQSPEPGVAQVQRETTNYGPRVLHQGAEELTYIVQRPQRQQWQPLLAGLQCIVRPMSLYLCSRDKSEKCFLRGQRECVTF